MRSMNLNLSPLVDWQLDMATNHHLSLKMINVHKISQIYWNIGQVQMILQKIVIKVAACPLPFEGFQPGRFEVPAACTTEESGVVSVHMVAPACLHNCIFACLHV